MTDIGQRIVAVASGFVGLVEVKANAKWDDPLTVGPDEHALDLEAVLLRGGWEPGAAYCASFYRGCLLTALKSLGAPEAMLLWARAHYSPSVMTTFFKNESRIVTTPTPGSMAIWQNGGEHYGHAGVVVAAELGGKKFRTIEANTAAPAQASDDDARQREGEGVFRRTRDVNFRRKAGLWLRGFIPPPVW